MLIKSRYRGGCDASGSAIVSEETPERIAATLIAEWGGKPEPGFEVTAVELRYLLWSPEEVEAICRAIAKS